MGGIRIVLILLLVTGLFACSKNQPAKDEGYLHVKVVGEDDVISWEDLTYSWEANTGNLGMAGTGYQYRVCRMDLQNLHSPGHVLISGLDQLYYEDGVQFVPDTVFGEINISEISSMHIRGTIDVQFADRSRNGQARLTGEFYSLSSK